MGVSARFEKVRDMETYLIGVLGDIDTKTEGSDEHGESDDLHRSMEPNEAGKAEETNDDTADRQEDDEGKRSEDTVSHVKRLRTVAAEEATGAMAADSVATIIPARVAPYFSSTLVITIERITARGSTAKIRCPRRLGATASRGPRAPRRGGRRGP